MGAKTDITEYSLCPGAGESKGLGCEPEVADQVVMGEAQLRRLLYRAGVELQGFTVFPGARPAMQSEQRPPQRLNVDV